MLKKLIIFIFVCPFFISCYFKEQNTYKLRNAENREFILATWNVGHFDYAINNSKELRSTKRNQRTKVYRDFINDSIASDIICINEYSNGINTFGRLRPARNSVFNNYQKKIVFDKFGAICNAIFSNIIIQNTKKCYFNCSTIDSERIERSAQFYYILTNLVIGTDTIKLICTHLDYKTPKLIQKQIAELIQEYGKYDRVIMCGDWNTITYNKFKKAGFILANDNSIITYPSKSYTLDNIVVKGVKISDIHVIKTNLSDHYPVVCKISIE